jgi:hypothetical protein
VHAVRVARHDAVARAALADEQLARGADDLGLRVVPVRERARGVQHRALAAVELDDGHAVVDVAQRRRPSCSAIVPLANARVARGLPSSQRARSMSCTLQSMKMPPEVGAKRTKKPSGSLRSQVCERTTKGRPIAAGGDVGRGARVARIEAAHEADHRDELRGRAATASTRSQSSTLSASGFSTNTCLPASSAAIVWSACSDVGVTSTTASSCGSRTKASKSSCSVATPSDRAPSQLGGDRAAGADELRAARAERELLGVALAEAAEAGDAHLQRPCCEKPSSRRAPVGANAANDRSR